MPMYYSAGLTGSDASEESMRLRSAFGFGVLSLVSCGGRSGLLEFEQSDNGGARAVAGEAASVAGTDATGGAMVTSGGSTASAGTSSTFGGTSPGGSTASGGASAVGPWATLSHQPPPVPHDNPFDYVGSATSFTDVWSDDPNRALIATVTPGYKAPSSASVVRFEGGAMLSFDGGASRLYGPPRITGLSLTDLWLAGGSFGLEHRDGSGWTRYAETTQLVWENAVSDVWGCCTSTSTTPNSQTYQLTHWDGNVWTRISLPPLDGFVPFGLWSRSATDTFVVGSGGRLLHWNGQNFEVQECPGVDVWRAVWGDDDAIWTAGDGGAVARWQGPSCTLLPTRDLLDGAPGLTDIWGSGPNNLWIVGQAGSILRWRGSALEREQLGLKDDLLAVWGNASGTVWVVGDNQTLLRRAF